jgi:hypothetical protein
MLPPTASLVWADERSAVAIAREYATQAGDFDNRIVLAIIIEFIDIKQAIGPGLAVRDAANNSSQDVVPSPARSTSRDPDNGSGP